MVEQMRAITDTAAKGTRKARRDAQRRTATPARRPDPVPVPPPPATRPDTVLAVAPFDVIEEW